MDAFETQVIPLLRPKGKAEARPPLEIGHPNTRLWGVNVITPGEIDSDMPESGGVYTCKFEAHEWCPSPPTVKKAKDKPKDASDEWAPYKNTAENLKNRFFELVPSLRPDKKPSSDAAKNL
jgi:hypothetical protein